MKKGALYGMRIIDLTTRLAGPFVTMLFADQGADVIKVEPPKMGDISRFAGPFLATDTEKKYSGYFQSINRNKKGIVLDLKTDDGKDILFELIKDADAIIENYADGTMKKLGLSYQSLKAINPKLVYGALRGFGDSTTYPSPYSSFPAYDVVAQAMGGLIGITGPDADTPVKAGPGLGDTIPGMLLAFGILSAIHHADKTGEGQLVDIAMTDAILYASERIVYQHSMTQKVPETTGNMHPFQSPFGVFQAKDGYVALGTPEQQLFSKLCVALDASEISEDDRFSNFLSRKKNRDELERLLNEVIKQFTKEELMERLGGIIPFGPIMKMNEIKKNPHFIARAMIYPLEISELDTTIDVAGNPIKMSSTEIHEFTRAPLHGEHHEKVLRDAGISEDIIQRTIPDAIDINAILKSV